jgi:hypothetical protein
MRTPISRRDGRTFVSGGSPAAANSRSPTPHILNWTVDPQAPRFEQGSERDHVVAAAAGAGKSARNQVSPARASFDSVIDTAAYLRRDDIRSTKRAGNRRRGNDGDACHIRYA